MKIELELKDFAEVLDHSLEDDVWDNRECVTSDSIKEALRDIILKNVAEKLCSLYIVTGVIEEISPTRNSQGNYDIYIVLKNPMAKSVVDYYNILKGQV